MKKTLGSVTTIVIAHRLTTVKDSDCIIVVKAGKKVEEGNHQSLLQNYPDGIYAKLVKADAASDQTADDGADEEPVVDVPVAELHPDLVAASQVVVVKKAENLERNPVAKAKLDEAEKTRVAYEAEVA